MIRYFLRVLGAAGVFCCGALAAARQTPTFRSGVDTVAIYATVRDANGRLVPNLTQADFAVLDDRQPATITTFSNDIVPITVALMMDTSSSLMPSFLRVREAAIHFLDVLLPGDRVRIGSFSDEVAVSPILTGDRAILTRLLNEELWLGNRTAMWNGIKAGMDSLMPETGRRVVVAVTDGHDDCGLVVGSDSLGESRKPPHRVGCVKPAEVAREATDVGFMLYAIGLEGPGLAPALSDLTERTGGGHVTLAKNSELETTLRELGDELHHQYLIGIKPSASDGRTHQLQVSVRPPGLTVKATRSYLAPGGGR